MTLEEFRNLDPDVVNGMVDSELKDIIQTVGKTANKRLKNISKYNTGVRAEEYKNFTTKGKNHNQLKQEVKRLQMFLDPSKKTYTVRGAEKYAKNLSHRLGLTWEKLSKGERTILMRVFDRVEDIYPGLSRRLSYGSSQISNTINVAINTEYANSLMEIEDEEERKEAISNYVDDIWGKVNKDITVLYESPRYR